MRLLLCQYSLCMVQIIKTINLANIQMISIRCQFHPAFMTRHMERIYIQPVKFL